MNTWILQGGFPLVTLEDGTITQVPFSYTSTDGPSNIGSNWKVPILSRSIDDATTRKQLLGSTPTALATTGVAVVNAGGSGFYRTAYGSKELATISQRLAWAAVLVGKSSITDLLRLAGGLGALNEPAAWTVVSQAVNMVNRLVDDADRDVLARGVRSLLAPQLARLGWERTKGEPDQARELRNIVIDLLGTIGSDPEVITEALRRFDANEVVGDLADAVTNITALQNRPGDEAVFEQRRLNAPTPQEEQIYLFAPANTPDLAKVTALFERCFTEIRNQDAPFLIAVMIRNRVTGAQIWRRLSARWDEAIARFPTGTPARSVSTTAALVADPELAREIRAFHAAHPVAAGQRQIEQALERMDIGVAFGERVRDSLGEQLRAFAG